MTPKQNAPALVSVIVPTRNSARTLQSCLESLRRQSHRPLELIVVDNASTDATPRIARELADVVACAGPERSAQRNRGLALATGDWVLWIDSDMVLGQDVVARALAAARHAGAAAVSLPERTVGPGFWTACRALERACYVDDPALGNPRLLRRSGLLALGGFDETMTGPEDTDLRHRLRSAGAVVVHCAAADVLIDHDEGRLTLAEVLRKRYYYGRSLPAFARQHPGALREQGTATLRALGRHRRLLARHPLHAAGLLVLRGAEAGAYLVGALRGGAP